MTSNNEMSKWLVLKEGQELGPLDFFEVIRLLKQNKIRSMDFIKKVEDRAWSQVADITDFRLHKFKSLSDSVLGHRVPLSNRRKYDRFKVEEKILLNHENMNVWADVQELGCGGVGIETIYGLLNVSETTKVHIKINELSINAIAKVVSKRDWKNPSDNSFIFRYGLKFIKFDQKSEIILNRIIKELKTNTEQAA